MPPSSTLRNRSLFTSMPTVSAAFGCSPTARTRRPHRVRNSATCTVAAMTYIRYTIRDWSKKIGPMIGMSDRIGIAIGWKTGGLFQVSASLSRTEE